MSFEYGHRFFQNSFTLTAVSHAPTVGSLTCLLHKNVLEQLVTPDCLIARLDISLSSLGAPNLRDVSYLMRDPCISIRTPPEAPLFTFHAPVFALKVIRNFECIIQH